MKTKICAVGALLTLASAAWAQTPGTPASNAVFVGGTPIIRVRVGSGGFTPDQRAQDIQQRVNRLLGTGPITPDEITVQPQGNEAVVMVKDQLLFTADWDTARYDHTTPTALAQEWADHMRQVLPRLTQPK